MLAKIQSLQILFLDSQVYRYNMYNNNITRIIIIIIIIIIELEVMVILFMNLMSVGDITSGVPCKVVLGIKCILCKDFSHHCTVAMFSIPLR